MLLVLLLSPIITYFGANTRIGLPQHYLEAGWLSFGGFVILCVALVVAIKLMWDNANGGKRRSLAAIFILLGCAAVLLQLLPNSPIGVRFLFSSPWGYASWFPFLVGLGVYVAIFVSGFAVVEGGPEAKVKVCSCLILAFSGNAFLSMYCNDSDTLALFDRNSSSHSNGFGVLNPNNIAQMEREKAKGVFVMEGIDSDINSLVHQLRDLGVNSVEELAGDESRRVLAEELSELLAQKIIVQRRYRDLNDTITYAKSLRRRAQRSSGFQANTWGKPDPAPQVDHVENGLKDTGGVTSEASLVFEVDASLKRLFQAP
jgi:hypothetical protein